MVLVSGGFALIVVDPAQVGFRKAAV